jgi:hypothetical protein
MDRTDWIFIVDFTGELGKQKAFGVLGVSQQRLVEEILPSERGLSHQDVELLGLYIMDSTRGEIIKEKLDELTLQVGKPIQIVADHSSDLARGIKLYKQENEDLIYTQTELSFLSPPAQRSQCRYFNIERLTEWGLNLLNCSLDTLIELSGNSEVNVINKKIIDKLGWLVDYQPDLIRWHQMTLLTRTIETQLKKSGINQQSLTYLELRKMSLPS